MIIEVYYISWKNKKTKIIVKISESEPFRKQQIEDLILKMKKIFNPLLDRRPEDLKKDCVHRIKKPPSLREVKKKRIPH